MNNKKTILYFLPYLTLLIFFSIYLFSLSTYIKLTKIINPNAIFSELNQVFLLNPSYVTQLLLVILCLSLLINSYFVKRHFYKKNILLNNIEVKKIILFIFIFTFSILLITFFVNILIIFINQNYYYESYGKSKKIINVYLKNTKILEYLFVFLVRNTYWFLITYLLIRFTNTIKKIFLFSLLLIFIYLISLTFGIVLYNIVHDVKTNYLIIMIISSLFPESINTLYNFNFIAGTISNITKNLFIINLIYFPSFIIFLVIILKTKWQKFFINKIKKIKLNQ